MKFFKKNSFLGLIYLFTPLVTFGGPEVHEFPFDYNEYGHIILEVKVEGCAAPLKFIFDTGGANVINTGYKGFETQDVPEIDKIQIADFTVDKVKFKKVNLSKRLGGDYIKSIAGMLGPKFMKEYIWQIDYQKQIIYLARNIEGIPLGGDIYKVPFKFSHIYEAPIVTLETKEVGKREYVIDTGSPGGITDYVKAFKKSLKNGKKLDYIRYTSEHRQISFLKNGNTTYAEGYTVKILNSKLGNMQIDETEIDFSNVAHVLIGNKFLEKFIVTLDWQGKFIYLEAIK